MHSQLRIASASYTLHKTDLTLPSNAGGVAANGLGNAKVNELELPLYHEEVGRLQI